MKIVNPSAGYTEFFYLWNAICKAVKHICMK